MADRLQRTSRALASRFALLRTRDFERNGIPRHTLKNLVRNGLWEKIGRGLYRSVQNSPGPNHSLLEVAQMSPLAVVCLLSALRYHELTSEKPTEVWIALPRNAWTPRLATLRLKVVHLSGDSFSQGIEEHRIEGVPVRIYSIAKTVADCFKFRNQIGTSVAVEALRDAWRSKRVTVDELWHHAKICRVSNVIRPYLESIVQ
jgi:predicted transcriptional regulator of viral defense system